MAEKIFFDPQLLLPIQRAGTISRQAARRPQAAGFDEMLAAAQSKITFSEHAKRGSQSAESRSASSLSPSSAGRLMSSPGKEPVNRSSISTARHSS